MWYICTVPTFTIKVNHLGKYTSPMGIRHGKQSNLQKQNHSKSKNPRRWTKGLPGNSISVFVYTPPRHEASKYANHPIMKRLEFPNMKRFGELGVSSFGKAVSWLFVSWLIRMITVFFSRKIPDFTDFRCLGPNVSVPTWYNMTYLDLHFVCKNCAEIHAKNLEKGRQI